MYATIIITAGGSQTTGFLTWDATFSTQHAKWAREFSSHADVDETYNKLVEHYNVCHAAWQNNTSSDGPTYWFYGHDDVKFECGILVDGVIPHGLHNKAA